MSSTLTDQQKLSLQALSQDLTRAALGRYRGQHKMAQTFTVEATKRLSELPVNELTKKIKLALESKEERSAEDLLMYATLTRNQAIHS